jgi:hypothetical protein
MTKARGWNVVGQEEDPGVISHAHGSAKNVREWTLTFTSELPCWELESQKDFRMLERDYKGQKSSPRIFFHIIGKLLKCRCLKWARIAYLDI